MAGSHLQKTLLCKKSGLTTNASLNFAKKPSMIMPIEYVSQKIAVRNLMKEIDGHDKVGEYRDAFNKAVLLTTHSRLLAQSYRTWITEETDD